MTTSQPGHRWSSSNVLAVLAKPVQYSLRAVRNDDGVRDRASIMTVLAKAPPPSDLSSPAVVFHGPNTHQWSFTGIYPPWTLKQFDGTQHQLTDEQKAADTA
jgi:hypothetical protein